MCVNSMLWLVFWDRSLFRSVISPNITPKSNLGYLLKVIAPIVFISVSSYAKRLVFQMVYIFLYTETPVGEYLHRI